MDQVVELINRRRNQNYSHTHSSNKEEQLATYKRFRLNFITMNVALCLLYQYEGKDGEQKLKEKIYDFIMTELPHKDSTNFHKFPYLIPLAYQLMKKILTSCSDKHEKDKLLNEVAKKAGESVKIIVEQQTHRTDRNSVSSNNILTIYAAILFIKIIFEIDNSILEPILDNLYG